MGELIIQRTEGGLGRRSPSKDMVTSFMMGGVAATGLALDTTSSELKKTRDAEDLGINAAYDTANNVLVYHHIEEFFRGNPSGSLYIRLTAQGTSLTDMCDPNNDHLSALLRDGGGDIRQAGVVLNPLTTYTPTLSGGLDADVLTAIDKAQLLADAEFALKRPVQIVIEGRNFNGTVATATDLRAKGAADVHVTILSDLDVSGTHAIHNGYAAIGTTLGTISAASVHESIGWTGKFNLSNSLTKDLLNPGMSSNKPVRDYELDYSTLTEKGYVFGRTYTGDLNKNGVYFDAFPTGADITSDYAWGNSRRTINKAVREVQTALFPRINAPILIDPETGTMEMAVAKSFEADAEQALNQMEQLGEISGKDAYVDPLQDVQETGKVLIQIAVVEVSTGRTLEVQIGLTKNL